MPGKGSKTKGGIFVSYRRAGVRTQTYRLVDELKRQFGESEVFLDIKSIDPGIRYADAIRDALNSCAVILVMIGPKWSEICDDQGRRRLDNPDDVLRIEVETALRASARVIPVLVDGAEMPSPESLPEDIRDLADLQAFTLVESHWEYDVAQLVGKLNAVLGRSSPAAPAEKTQPVQPKFSGKVITGLVLIGLMLLTYLADEITDSSAALGGLVFVIAGIVLSVIGYRDIRVGKTRGRGMAISGAVVGGLLALVLLDEMRNLPDPESVVPQTWSAAPREPIPAESQQAVEPVVSAPPQPALPEPQTEPLTEPQYQLPGESAPEVVNLAGHWSSPEGLTYIMEQVGNQVTFAEFNPLLNTVTAGGAGMINGRDFVLTYQTALGTSGQAHLRVSDDGASMSGNYTDLSTGVSQYITLERE